MAYICNVFRELTKLLNFTNEPKFFDGKSLQVHTSTFDVIFIWLDMLVSK